MRLGAGGTSLERAANAGRDSGSSKPPALKLEPRSGAKPPAKHFDPKERI